MADRKPIAPNDRSTVPQYSAADLRGYKAFSDSDSNAGTMKKALNATKEATSVADRNTASDVATQNSRAKNGQSPITSYKKGGMVKKTGLAKLHAGEKVIRKQDVKRTVKAVRKYGGKR